MYDQPKWGNVNLGADVLQGHGEQSQPGSSDFHRNHPGSKNKQQYNPGRNQELKLPPDIFRMRQGSDYNPYSPSGKIPSKASIHERIKELLGEGIPRREAVLRAKRESEKSDSGPISQKEVYRHKYQAPSKRVTPFTEQIQESPFI